MTERVVYIETSMTSSEADQLIELLNASGNSVFTYMADKLKNAMAETPYMVSVDHETAACKLLCDTCDVEGCNLPADKDSVNNFCTVHDDRWHGGEKNWDRPVESDQRSSEKV